MLLSMHVHFNGRWATLEKQKRQTFRIQASLVQNRHLASPPDSGNMFDQRLKAERRVNIALWFSHLINLQIHLTKNTVARVMMWMAAGCSKSPSGAKFSSCLQLARGHLTKGIWAPLGRGSTRSNVGSLAGSMTGRHRERVNVVTHTHLWQPLSRGSASLHDLSWVDLVGAKKYLLATATTIPTPLRLPSDAQLETTEAPQRREGNEGECGENIGKELLPNLKESVRICQQLRVGGGGKERGGGFPQDLLCGAKKGPRAAPFVGDDDDAFTLYDQHRSSASWGGRRGMQCG